MSNGGWTPTRPLPPAPVPAPSPPQRDYDAEWRIQRRWIAELLNQNATLRAALKELVACKDLADKFDAMKVDVPDYATAAVLDGIHAEYQRRKPAAWEAAREALRLENLEMK